MPDLIGNQDEFCCMHLGLALIPGGLLLQETEYQFLRFQS